MIDLIAINHHGIAVRLSFMHASQETMLVAVDPNNRRQDAISHTEYSFCLGLKDFDFCAER